MTVTKIYSHGDPRRYRHNGCRCDPCRQAASKDRNRDWYRLNHGDGPAEVPAGPTRQEVKQLKRTGLSFYEMQRRSGVNRMTMSLIFRGNSPVVRSSTRDKIHLLWQDVFGENGEFWDPLHPERAHKKGSGRNGPAIWPRLTLREKYLEKHGVIPEDLFGRLSNRHPMMSTVTAERTAVELGFMPHEVWKEWSGRVEAV